MLGRAGTLSSPHFALDGEDAGGGRQEKSRRWRACLAFGNRHAVYGGRPGWAPPIKPNTTLPRFGGVFLSAVPSAISPLSFNMDNLSGLKLSRAADERSAGLLQWRTGASACKLVARDP